MHRLMNILLWLAAIAALTAASGCSTRKNSAANRQYQAFITRYNILFNGDEHYRQTLADMERSYDDDFTRMLPVHPAEARRDPKAPQPQGDFGRSIEKAQKAIRVRSIKKKPRRQAGRRSDPEYRKWMQREEYNPYLHHAWMLLGRSRYMNGEFLPAATTFMYIANHFSWLPQTVAEARIWQARSYLAEGWTGEAEATLGRVRESDLTSGELRHQYALAQAEAAIGRRDWKGASAPLSLAASTAKGAQKTRLTYLLGQVMLAAGDKAGAAEAFRKVEKSSSSAYVMRFNARIRRSETTGLDAMSADALRDELKALARMTRYDRNARYLDQIHYAAGNISMALGDTATAMHSYALAAEKSERRGVDMALARLALGRLYFERADYDHAQPCYAEAVALLPETFEGIRQIRDRSDVLDELAVYSRTVSLNDSLLRLADMPEAERLKVIDGIIERLRLEEQAKAEEEERQRREAEAADNTAAIPGSTSGNASAPSTFTRQSGDGAWYFYNRQAIEAGRAEFRRRWGTRKPEDNWRRSDKATYAGIEPDDDTDSAGHEGDGSGQAASDSTATPKQGAKAASDPHQRAYYLAQIPSDSISRKKAHDAIQEGLFNMGLILKDKLDDYTEARRHWDRLLRQYPDNIYRPELYHNLYLMAARNGDDAEAERWRMLMAGEFADTPLGKAMANPDYLRDLKEMHSRQERLYAEAYEAYLANDNDSVRKAAEYAVAHYPTSRILPKFLFIDALTYATQGDTQEFRSRLKNLVTEYPDADVSPLAAGWLRESLKGRKINSTGSNVRGMIWATRLTSDSAAMADGTADSPAEISFERDEHAPHLVVLAFAVDTVNPNSLLYNVARYNFATFAVRDFDLEPMQFGPLGLLAVKGFADRAEASRYLALLLADPESGLTPEVKPLVISQPDFTRLLGAGLSLDDYLRGGAEEPEGSELSEQSEEIGIIGEAPGDSDSSDNSDNSDNL